MKTRSNTKPGKARSRHCVQGTINTSRVPSYSSRRTDILYAENKANPRFRGISCSLAHSKSWMFKIHSGKKLFLWNSDQVLQGSPLSTYLYTSLFFLFLQEEEHLRISHSSSDVVSWWGPWGLYELSRLNSPGNRASKTQMACLGRQDQGKAPTPEVLFLPLLNLVPGF